MPGERISPRDLAVIAAARASGLAYVTGLQYPPVILGEPEPPAFVSVMAE
jgi:hypothetical protein